MTPPTPEQVFASIAHIHGAAWLDGGTVGPWSILVCDPVEIVTDPADWPRAGRALTGRSAGDPNLPFVGGCLGYLGYEAGHAVERVPVGRPTPEPPIWLARYRGALCWHHPTRTWHVGGEIDGAALLAAARALPEPAPAVTRAHRTIGREDFEAAVRRALSAIADGEVYQINLSRPAWVEAPGDAFDAWRRLRRLAPAEHGAWLRLAADLAIASVSPETFLTVDGDVVRTLPIKGTHAASAEALRDDPKELAELTMIVDLSRNDLGRVARPGTVKVGPRRIRSHGYVWHASQEVSAALVPGLDAWDALAAAFPPGSVTGCPKVRATEWIHTLEPHPRGVYCGAIGFCSSHGRASWSVAIRTAVLQPDVARYHVGAGVVADSNPAAEWFETEAKAAPLRGALAGPPG